MRRKLSPSGRYGKSGAACILAGLVSLLALANCTLVTARTNGQCLDDQQCRSRGPQFASTRCSAVGTCEAITLPEAGADAGTSCDTNQQCNTVLSTSARCVDRQCVALLGSGCTKVDGDPTDPNAIFLGVMTPLTGQNSAYGLNQYQVVQAAAAEWNANITGQANTHPFVTIGCDERADPGGTSTFLASKVQAAAIFGPIYDVDFAAAAAAATLNGTIMAGSRADDPNLSTYAGAGKTIWSWQPNRKIQAAYLNNLVSVLEPSVKTSQGVTTGDLKVALVVATGDDTSSADFATLVEPTLAFNGKTTTQNGANYTRVNIPFSFTTANIYTTTVATLVQAAPDLVIVTQEYDLLAFVRAVNNGWTGAKFPRFLFLTEDPSVDGEVELPKEKFSGKLDFVTWTRSAQEQQNASTFAVSFRTATGGDPASFSESLYDAFYENAYALQTVLDSNSNVIATLDPGAYSSAIASFNSPGSPINVGVGSGTPNNIAQMLTLVAGKTDVDLEGASGPLEFGATSGSPIQNAELRCIKSGANSVSTSGVTFDGKTGAATGAYSCL